MCTANKSCLTRLSRCCSLLLFLFTCLGLEAQPFQVTGKIRCYKTKELIPAKVTFEKQPDAGLTFISHVSEDGYTATIVRPGTYLLKASLPGYIPELHQLNLDHDSLKSKDKIVCNFNLVPIMLDDILPFRNILFEPASSVISRLAQPELSLLLEIMKENPKIFIRLEGHTDNVSKSRRSLNLAKKRIRAVKKYLTDNSILPDRIELKAIGGGNTLVNTGNIDAHKLNRRVEIRVTAL
jgi:outer membrane protein OmpA-like peptidoglycan-associated protein